MDVDASTQSLDSDNDDFCPTGELHEDLCVDGEPVAEADQYLSDDVDDSSMSDVSSDIEVSDSHLE